MMSYEDEEEEEACAAAAVAEDDKDTLPDGWKRARDAKSGRGYYYNKRAKQSSWTRPVETSNEAKETRDSDVGGAAAAAANDATVEADDDEDGEEGAMTSSDARALAQRVMSQLEARCENVAARALATPRAVLRYREAMDVLAKRSEPHGERLDAALDAERMREIERGLDDDAREYEEWTREAETETVAVEAETKAEAHVEDALASSALDDVSPDVDARAQRTIARPPAPPLPKDERPPAPPAPSVPAVKRKRLAMSNARRHKETWRSGPRCGSQRKTRVRARARSKRSR